jgi:hypothetical protein
MARKRRRPGAATPTRRNTTQALDRAKRASDVINTSNNASKDHPTPRPPTVARVRDREGRRPAGGPARDAVGLSVRVARDWLAYFLRRWGDRRFAMNDTEAHWWGWQITKTLGGLGRRYRDVRFDALAACLQCAGAGVWTDDPCGPCLGTGRITLEEVS